MTRNFNEVVDMYVYTHTYMYTCMHMHMEFHVCKYAYLYETFGLSMEIFKYEYNLSRKNIKNNKPYLYPYCF